MEMEEPTPDTVARPLRLLAIASYAPSFALCIAHGVLSHQPVPAVGLVPQTVSAVTAILLLRAAANPADADVDAESVVSSEPHCANSIRARLTHPITVFALDIVLAASLMVVLVFTWIDHSDSPSLSMLAAYATMPIFASFSAHLLAGLQAIYEGLAIHSIVQWLAWRAVPPECPSCSYHLRPSSLPELPWLKYFQRRRSYVRVLAQDDQERYHDESGDEAAEPPAAVEVISKKKRKSKTTPVSSDESSETDLPWGSSARVY